MEGETMKLIEFGINPLEMMDKTHPRTHMLLLRVVKLV